VTATAQRPILFLDVDGPLIPFGTPPARHPDGHPTYRVGHPNPLLARINPAHGTRLAALACDLVWATTWMADANECVAPLLGLPQLPVVAFPEPSDADRWDGLHWKTRTLVAWAGGRAFAWVDDEITDADRTWVSAHHRAPALLHRVDPREGITDADHATLHEWTRRQVRHPLPATRPRAQS
jgi:hypothetical protein